MRSTVEPAVALPSRVPPQPPPAVPTGIGAAISGLDPFTEYTVPTAIPIEADRAFLEHCLSRRGNAPEAIATKFGIPIGVVNDAIDAREFGRVFLNTTTPHAVEYHSAVVIDWLIRRAIPVTPRAAFVTTWLVDQITTKAREQQAAADAERKERAQPYARMIHRHPELMPVLTLLSTMAEHGHSASDVLQRLREAEAT
jgi:hypothetical protein